MKLVALARLRDGVSPSTRQTALVVLKRAGTSTMARSVSATARPTPGTVIFRQSRKEKIVPHKNISSSIIAYKAASEDESELLEALVACGAGVPFAG
jgi:hypothetical protein